jgi:acyl carrier protein
MTRAPAKRSSPRLAIAEALRVGAPGALTDEARRAFLDTGENIVLAELGMDSLGEMEFCIAIELATGVTLLPSDLAALESTEAVERRIREKQDEAAPSATGAAR